VHHSDDDHDDYDDDRWCNSNFASGISLPSKAIINLSPAHKLPNRAVSPFFFFLYKTTTRKMKS